MNVFKYPKVILIGGAPMTGKTTVARRLSATLGHGCLSTDDIGQAARAVTDAQTHPALHPMEGYDYREYYAIHSVQKLIDDSHRHHEAIWPAVEAIIHAHATWDTPVVIEGWALNPERVANLKMQTVASLWLVGGENVQEDRIRREPDFFQGASDEKAMIANFLGRGIRFNAELRAAVTTFGLTAVHLTPETTTDDLYEACMRLLTTGHN